MKITAEFDSLDELRAFADSFHTPTVVSAQLPQVDLVLPSGAIAHLVEATKHDGREAEGAQADAAKPAASDDAQSAATEEKPKRTRRTKAQIAADEAAERATQIAALTQPPVDNAHVQEGAEQFAETGTVPHEAINTPPAGFVSAPPAVETPFDQAAKVAQKEEPAAAPVASTQLSEDSPTRAQIELRQAEIMAAPYAALPQFVLTHSRAAREYIQHHGMAAYTETQNLWGLPADVMRYTAEQRALHLATMQVLGPLLGNGAAA